MYDAKNRLTGMPYDPTGNGSPITGRTYQYDVENRLVAVNGGTPALNESFAYDGEGRRVKRTVNGVTTTYVYDAFGQLAQEYGGSAGSPGRSYLFADHLGSTRMMTSGDGTVRGWWDYLPYGEEIAGDRGNRTAVAGFAYGGEEPSMMFTGQVRDRLADGAASGLDYFGARYMSAAQGRFVSPDAPFADQHPVDPQSWNLYSYVRNNPVTFTDSTGQYVDDCKSGDAACT
ncbi:MAG: RHS repeat-associated core domain-containing protein, partial [Bryobacteraceae bacterium]|nr:RHS repeat-associated core domain-containing protein [Bryobacteraceae bacterium]